MNTLPLEVSLVFLPFLEVAALRRKARKSFLRNPHVKEVKMLDRCRFFWYPMLSLLSETRWYLARFEYKCDGETSWMEDGRTGSQVLSNEGPGHCSFKNVGFHSLSVVNNSADTWCPNPTPLLKGTTSPPPKGIKLFLFRLKRACSKVPKRDREVTVAFIRSLFLPISMLSTSFPELFSANERERGC